MSRLWGNPGSRPGSTSRLYLTLEPNSIMSALSHNVVLTSDEKAFFTNKTDEYFINVGIRLRHARKQILHSEKIQQYVEDMTNRSMDSFPTYKDPVADTPIRVANRLLAELIDRHVANKNAQLIDIGAGTGYLGIEVRKLGYSKIDCIEPCQTYQERQPTGLYGKVYTNVLSSTKPCPIENGVYDCAMLSAVVLPGFIDVDEIPELLRIVKPGGHVIFSISDQWFKYQGFGDNFDKYLQKELEKGTLSAVGKERGIYCYQVEDATIFVLKKAASLSE